MYSYIYICMCIYISLPENVIRFSWLPIGENFMKAWSPWNLMQLRCSSSWKKLGWTAIVFCFVGRRSMCEVYLPTWMVMFDGKLVGKYTFSVSVCGKILWTKKRPRFFWKSASMMAKLMQQIIIKVDIHRLIIKVIIWLWLTLELLRITYLAGKIYSLNF